MKKRALSPLSGVHLTIKPFIRNETEIGNVSGIRESNPPPRLGKPVHYRCANSANGADTRTRTGDLRITNALLYQLSHIGDVRAKVKTKGRQTKTNI